MKKYAFILGLLSMGACESARQKKQTTQEFTVLTYALDWNKNQFVTSVAQRIIKDTFALSVVDSTANEVKQKRVQQFDTSYLIPIADTIKDQFGIKKLDSIGNPQIQYVWVPLPKSFLVYDFNRVVK